MTKRQTKGVKPFRDSRFSVVSFLAAPNKADDHGPRVVPVKI